MDRKWSQILVVLLVGVGVGYMMARFPVDDVQAQGSGSAPGVAVVLGERDNDKIPIGIVDPLEQTLMVYEYDDDGTIELHAVRSYRYDRKLRDYHNEGISVRSVMERLR